MTAENDAETIEPADDGERPEPRSHESCRFDARLDDYVCIDCGEIVLDGYDYDY